MRVQNHGAAGGDGKDDSKVFGLREVQRNVPVAKFRKRSLQSRGDQGAVIAEEQQCKVKEIKEL